MSRKLGFTTDYEDEGLLDSLLNPIKASSIALTTSMEAVTGTLSRHNRREEQVFEDTVLAESMKLEVGIAKLSNKLMTEYGYTKEQVLAMRGAVEKEATIEDSKELLL